MSTEATEKSLQSHPLVLSIAWWCGKSHDVFKNDHAGSLKFNLRVLCSGLFQARFI